ncbi:predicted protein [Sclerotinia sclerotiorum 1980 UF-70]|uniref:Uncharacterized protein n=1 Tax=Sclerotinia sclerotiorum (strain ATCC 18683 / 1980 / Ss-1) TaxID=665079 RepID=A7EM31_SCLS1|nr:predicted protein [Sclerotinia sclerotiorum 1980 UF-70]EDO03897.1 predicted protein [Sclerotinia sclerotiorum 1980 UF-70]
MFAQPFQVYYTIDQVTIVSQSLYQTNTKTSGFYKVIKSKQKGKRIEYQHGLNPE